MQIRDIRRIEDVIRANQNVISASHPVLFGGLAEATWKCRFLMMMKFLFLFLYNLLTCISGKKPRICGIISCSCSLSYNMMTI